MKGNFMVQQRHDKAPRPGAALRDCPYVTAVAFDSPVGLVVTRLRDRINAMTVSLFSEVAHHPTSMWVSIERDTYTHELISEAAEFTFVTLHQNQAGLAIACGTESGRHRDKCTSLELYDNGSGFLFLRGALASTACRIFRAAPVGNHTLFLAYMLSGDVYCSRSSLRNLLLSDLIAE